MTSLRQFRAEDLLRTSLPNLDPLTENYDLSFYNQYLAVWPELFTVAEDIEGNVIGYMMGKLEEDPLPFAHQFFSQSLSIPLSDNYLPWHGHVTALTVAPQSRRMGLAKTLTEMLERGCESADAWFVDLFVRQGNAAVELYRKMGYSTYRRVLSYYSDDPTGRSKTGAEDAFDMRKPLKRDKTRKYIRENGEDFRILPEELYS